LSTPDPSIDIQVVGLTEFFRESLHGAAAKYKLTLTPHAECYLVNLMTGYSRAEAYFERTSNGGVKPPLLTLLLAHAISASSPREQERGMQRLGDVALFTVGFFAHSFSRKIIDVDYYVAMGGNAYATLSDRARTPGLCTIRPVFAELAKKFVPIMDALNELSDQAHTPSTHDLLRYYEMWLKTGSRRSYKKLVEAGLDPVSGNAPLSRQ
jgi:hypothetical protein